MVDSFPAHGIFPTQIDLDWTFQDLKSIFTFYDGACFHGRLSNVVVEWSATLTRAAGVCVYTGTRRRETKPIVIRISEPILQYRSHFDLLNVLVHEMVHAYLFRLKIFEVISHGPIWQAEAARVNRATGLNITVYHNYYDEVRHVQMQRFLRRSLVIKGSRSPRVKRSDARRPQQRKGEKGNDLSSYSLDKILSVRIGNFKEVSHQLADCLVQLRFYKENALANRDPPDRADSANVFRDFDDAHLALSVSDSSIISLSSAIDLTLGSAGPEH